MARRAVHSPETPYKAPYAPFWSASPGRRLIWFPNLYLKFSELQLLEGDDKAFGSLYGATSSAVLTEFLSPQEIIDMPEEESLPSLAGKSRNRISDLSKTSELLRKATRDSYRLDKCMYEPLNISLASSFNCIHAYQKEIS